MPSNIAEGYGRISPGEYKQFLGIARGSNAELQTQFLIGKGLEMGDPGRIEKVNGLSEEVSKMIYSILKKL